MAMFGLGNGVMGSRIGNNGDCGGGVLDQVMSLMKEHGIDAYLTYTVDEHLNEYVGKDSERLRFLTGFSGSNGIAVTCEYPVLYTDSRYYIQAQNQSLEYKLKKMEFDESLSEYLVNVCGNKQVGVCGRLISSKKYEDLKNKLESKGLRLHSIDIDLVDMTWRDKPQRVFNVISSIEDVRFREYQEEMIRLCDRSEDRGKMMNELVDGDVMVVGRRYKDKLEVIRKLLKPEETFIITELDTIAWIFNLRGEDIKYNPVFYSYSVVSKDQALLFINGGMNGDVSKMLDGVEIRPYEEFESYIMRFKSGVVISGKCNAHIRNLFDDARCSDGIRNLQSLKMDIELDGFRLAYIFDGMALTCLFEWIDSNVENGISEKDVARRLEEIKESFHGYIQPSFASIVGGGPNGAIVHHSASDKVLTRDELLLIDCGSQYVFGTTDTTRTLHFGDPSDEQRMNYTRVLKGQLRAMRMKYPRNTHSSALDVLSRLDLWKEKMDYGHATGHGVGHFLCVHESPPVISSTVAGDVLKPSQVFSIEPGLYKEGEYGIRIENLVYMKEIGDEFNGIVNLTFVPYQLSLIDISMMDGEEIEYLNQINSEIRCILEPLMYEKPGYEFLMRNTEQI